MLNYFLLLQKVSLKILEIISDTNKSLHQLKKEMVKYPQVNLTVKKDDININDIKLQDAILELKKDVKNIIVRKSGTEPLVRIMVEAKDIKIANKHAKYLFDLINDI